MKKIPFLILSLLFFFSSSFSQEVQFSPAVIPSGGSCHSNGALTFSRWRIGQINVLTLPSDENSQKLSNVANTSLPADLPFDWSVTLFPNPVQSKLNVCLNMANEREFTFEIFDVTGRKMMSENPCIIYPGQVHELDLSHLTPALYLLKIIPSGEGSFRKFKISRQ